MIPSRPPRRNRDWHHASALLPWLLLAGCAGTGAPPPAPPKATLPPVRLAQNPETPTPPDAPDRPDFYQVRPGETLSAIAKANNLAPEQLAAWNRITRPNQLRAGQKLRLTPPGTPAAPNRKNPAVASEPSLAPVELPSPPPPTNLPDTPLASGWVWPHPGRILTYFGRVGALDNPGIDIAVTPGDPVLAASDGVVAYANPGLTNFGNMILLRHRNAFMSTYAHLDKILVKPGQSVKAGETIALAGQSGVTVSPRLHFEIRRSIAPHNPLLYLPRKD
ncbi:MAG: M23 family metallopeptidase [Magnetococcales bacterium]|nr:M23 family metallopeptidase [Magnetococcales bacterium]